MTKNTAVWLVAAETQLAKIVSFKRIVQSPDFIDAYLLQPSRIRKSPEAGSHTWGLSRCHRVVQQSHIRGQYEPVEPA